MKIRNGFVSNSSSSSFIVAFDKKPESIEDLRGIIDLSEFRSDSDKEYALECLLSDIQKFERSASVLEIVNAYNSSYYGDDPLKDALENTPFKYFNIDNRMMSELSKNFDKKAFQKDYSEITEEFLDSTKFVATFHFSDENGDFWGTMEHGGIFSKLPHVQISHH